MQTNKLKTLLTLGSTVLLLGACSTRETEDSAPQTDADETEEVVETADAPAEEKEEEAEEEVSEIGKRSNPVAVGETVVYTETYHDEELENEYEARFEMTITDVVRGEDALAIVKAENSYNEPAPEGMEWAVITIEGTLIEGDEDVPYTVIPWFSVIDASGSEVPQDDYASLDGNEYGYVDLFPGGQTSGRITKYMPVDDASLLVLEDMFGSGIYFSLTDE